MLKFPNPEPNPKVCTVLPSTAWQFMSMELYSTFWGLGLSDIDVPRAQYDKHIKVSRHTKVNI